MSIRFDTCHIIHSARSIPMKIFTFPWGDVTSSRLKTSVQEWPAGGGLSPAMITQLSSADKTMRFHSIPVFVYYLCIHVRQTLCWSTDGISWIKHQQRQYSMANWHTKTNTHSSGFKHQSPISTAILIIKHPSVSFILFHDHSNTNFYINHTQAPCGSCRLWWKTGRNSPKTHPGEATSMDQIQPKNGIFTMQDFGQQNGCIL